MRNRYQDDPWELPDVPAFLDDVAHRVELRPGLDLLVVVDDSEVRRVLDVAKLSRPAKALPDPSELARKVIEKPMARLCPGYEVPPPPHCTAHLLRCREGRVVPARDDIRWAYGLLYARNGINTLCGDVVVLTPHGWRVGQRSGLTPTLTSLGHRRLRVVELSDSA
jgi:hypothetical protein